MPKLATVPAPLATSTPNEEPSIDAAVALALPFTTLPPAPR